MTSLLFRKADGSLPCEWQMFVALLRVIPLSSVRADIGRDRMILANAANQSLCRRSIRGLIVSSLPDRNYSFASFVSNALSSALAIP